MDRKNVKEILDLCKRAKFNEALDIIKSTHGKIHSKWITAIIIGCCNTCVASVTHSKNISEDDLFSLLNHIVFYIKEINEDDLLSYMQSLYHILKLFVNKVRNKL